MASPQFRLAPLHCGSCTLGENHLFGGSYSDDNRVPFALYSFLADGGPGRRVLIDLGPVGLTYLNDMFRQYEFFRKLPGDPDAIVQPHGNVFAGLERAGLAPEDINHIVLTHMHADHHGLVDGTDAGAILDFLTATVHVSGIGWQNNLDKRVDGKWNSYVDYQFSDFLLEAGREGRARFHDDDEVLPGLDVIHLGGHAPCSQAVRVQTPAGPAVVTSDEIYRFDILGSAVIARLHTTPENLKEATEKLVHLAHEGAILLPCHDPVLWEVYEAHGEEWLEHLRPVSDNAVHAFASTPPRSII